MDSIENYSKMGAAIVPPNSSKSSIEQSRFICNPDAEAKLNSDDYQERLPDALMRGIEGYLSKNPPQALVQCQATCRSA